MLRGCTTTLALAFSFVFVLMMVTATSFPLLLPAGTTGGMTSWNQNANKAQQQQEEE